MWVKTVGWRWKSLNKRPWWVTRLISNAITRKHFEQHRKKGKLRFKKTWASGLESTRPNRAADNLHGLLSIGNSICGHVTRCLRAWSSQKLESCVLCLNKTLEGSNVERCSRELDLITERSRHCVITWLSHPHTEDFSESSIRENKKKIEASVGWRWRMRWIIAKSKATFHLPIQSTGPK